MVVFQGFLLLMAVMVPSRDVEDGSEDLMAVLVPSRDGEGPRNTMLLYSGAL